MLTHSRLILPEGWRENKEKNSLPYDKRLLSASINIIKDRAPREIWADAAAGEAGSVFEQWMNEKISRAKLILGVTITQIGYIFDYPHGLHFSARSLYSWRMLLTFVRTFQME